MHCTSLVLIICLINFFQRAFVYLKMSRIGLISFLGFDILGIFVDVPSNHHIKISLIRVQCLYIGWLEIYVVFVEVFALRFRIISPSESTQIIV